MEEALKVCNGCKQELPFDKYHKRGKGYQSLCKECRKEYDKAFWQRKRQEYMIVKNNRRREISKKFSEYKGTLKCLVCEENSPECLDFHHTDPNTKEYNITDLARRGYSMKAIMREVEKCVVLCANCHRKYHAGTLELTMPLQLRRQSG